MNNATPECLQACLTMIAEWSGLWQLKLSAFRCFVLHIKPVQSQRCSLNNSYHIGDVALPPVNTVNDLGVTYNNHLSFTQRRSIDIVCKASLRAKLVLNCFQSREPHLLNRAFFAFVRPILEYYSVTWTHDTNIASIRLKLPNSVLQKNCMDSTNCHMKIDCHD